MPARNSKGRFVKGSGGGRKSGRARRAASTAVVVVPQRAPARRRRAASPARRSTRRRGRRSEGMGKLLPYAVGALALGYVAGEGNVPEFKSAVEKIPGAKTLGTPLTIGLAALAVNRFAVRNRYLKLIGTVGCIVGAYQLGVKKLDVKWVGDPDDGGPLDDVGY